MADDQTSLLGPAVDGGGVDQKLLEQLQARLLAPPAVARPDQTPVEHDWRWALASLGNAMGGAGVVDSLSPTQQRAAGLRALGDFSTGLMQSAHYQPGKTIFSNLGQGFDAADRSVINSERQGANLLAARQTALTQGQKEQIEGIKAALPLLQQQAALKGLPATLLGPTANVGAGGSIGGDGTYVGAIGGHEGTGKNPNSSAVGVGQFIDSTWADFVKENPSYFVGMTPEQAMAARKNPEFGAKVGPVAIEWLAKKNADALTGAGVTPSGQSLGIAHYLGVGTAAKVMTAPDNTPVSQFVSAAALAANPELRTMTVGQMKQRYAGTPAPTFLRGAAPAPGQPTPAAPPGRNPDAKVTIPPPTQAAPERPTLPQPGPAMAQPEPGTAQTAGPAGPTGTIVPPSPPGSAGTVAAIKEGMVAAGADPTTLAAGPGSKPGLAPGANVTAQLTPLPPGMDPNSREAYGILHPIVPPPEVRALFNPQPDPDQLAAIAVRKQNAERDYQSAKLSKDPVAAAATARALFDKATADENTLRENARKLGVDKQAEFYKDRRAQLDAAWAAEQADRLKQQDFTRNQQAEKDKEERAHALTLAAETHKSNEAIRVADSAREGTYVTKERERFSNDRESTRTAIDQIDILGALSEKAGTAAPLELMTTAGGVPVSAVLGKMGLGDTATREHWGAQQAFNAVKNQMIIELRKGVQMGALSDRDMDFLKGMGPDLMQDPTTRKEILGLLEQVQRQKRTYLDTVENLYDDGHAGISWNTAKRQADAKMPPMVPSLPKEYTSWPPELRKEWKQKNLRPGQFVRDTEGNLGTYNPRGQ